MKLMDTAIGKDSDKNTTSKKFKNDLIEYFDTPEFADMKALELGCSNGYTTMVLSHLFKEVHAVDRDAAAVETAISVNKGRSNITFYHKDVYNEPFNYPQDIRVVWIDAGHDYNSIKYDLARVIEYFNDPIIIFDDNAHPNVGVKEAVGELLNNNMIEDIKYIGELGKNLVSAKKTTQFRPDDYEGLILRLKKKKDIIFMLNIKLEGEGRWSPTRSLPYKYSISSWERWANKHNKELFVLDQLLVPIEQMGICWQRYYLFDLLENSNIKYDQILMVDADTIVHPETPDFFKMTDYKWTVCEFDGSWDWVLRSMEAYSKYIFNSQWFNFWEYYDAGWILINKHHKSIYKYITDFYQLKEKELKQMESLHVGTDQTPVNFISQLSDISMKHLPYIYNMNDMMRKEILTEDLLFMQVGYIPQFNAIPNNTNNQAVQYWMEKTHKHFYGELK